MPALIEDVRARLRPELIGPADCPIIKRWTLLQWGRRERVQSSVTETSLMDKGGGEAGSERGLREGTLLRQPPRAHKLLLHWFPGRMDDRDVHDHPRAFWTVVLWGWYWDVTPCPRCGGSGAGTYPSTKCWPCGGSGEMRELMHTGRIAHRNATHRHRTEAGSRGALTVVGMGPIVRRWGFWRDSVWWPWKEYRRAFGHGTVCDKDAD